MMKPSTKCWISAVHAQGSGGIRVAVQVGAVKIYVAAVEALRKTERQGETQEPSKFHPFWMLMYSFCRFFLHRVWPNSGVVVLSFLDFMDIANVSWITLCLGVKRKAYRVTNEIVQIDAFNCYFMSCLRELGLKCYMPFACGLCKNLSIARSVKWDFGAFNTCFSHNPLLTIMYTISTLQRSPHIERQGSRTLFVLFDCSISHKSFKKISLCTCRAH
jgi:hypothetical protein